jgi:hypothetical protein
MPRQGMALGEPAVSLNGTPRDASTLMASHRSRRCRMTAGTARTARPALETGHPVAAGLQSGTSWRWCYVHQSLA